MRLTVRDVAVVSARQLSKKLYTGIFVSLMDVTDISFMSFSVFVSNDKRLLELTFVAPPSLSLQAVSCLYSAASTTTRCCSALAYP